MGESGSRRFNPLVALLIGILLTLLTVLGHRFLPERRLTLDSAREGANFYPVHLSNGPPADFRWIDASHFHFTCLFPQQPVYQGCGMAYALTTDVTKGIDLSRFHTLILSLAYTGTANQLRVSIRNFDARFSTAEDLNSPKFNFVNVPIRDVGKPIAIGMSEFAVAEWWTFTYNHPREYSRPDVSNATVLNIDLQGDLAGTQHEMRIDKIELVGDWISAELWYLGILCVWMILGTTYGTTQWMKLRRRHRAQRRRIDELAHEKERYQKLSTIDALTKVLNRHGIDEFVAALRAKRMPASVIILDLDHFKRVNDERGHHVGDRVLRTMGEILRAGVRNTDAVGRWGGEEFVLVCPGASLASAAELAEKLRQKIMKTSFIPEEPLPISASFGVANSKADQPFEDVFRQADEALYLAKSRGRNCVVAAAEDQMHKMTGARTGTWAMLSGRFKLHR